VAYVRVEVRRCCSMDVFESGDRVLVRSSFEGVVERRALTDVVMGHDFKVVWVCTEDEWQAAATAGRQPEGVPWPAADVESLPEHADA
jgi:hypothetical protein